MGRFITEDPARAGSNYYIYVSNNPLKYTDPTGLYRVYSYFDHEAGTEKYRMSTENEYHGGALLYNVSNAVFKVIPFGALFDSLNRNLYNSMNKLTGVNSQVEYNSFERSIDGLSLAADLIQLHPLAKSAKSLKGLMDSYGTVSKGSGIFGAYRDTKTEKQVQNFLDEVDYNLLGNAESPEEAIGMAKIFESGAKAFYDLDLEEQGVSKYDWAVAIRDTISGESSELFDSVFDLNEIKE